MHKQLAINFGHGCCRLWWQKDAKLHPSKNPIQHTFSRIPLPILQDFKKVQSLCGNMFDLLHTTQKTSLQHEASERFLAWKLKKERFYSINSTPIQHSFDHGISNSSHSLPTKHHKHPPSLQLVLFFTTHNYIRISLENLKQGKN